MTLEMLLTHPVIGRLGWALAHFVWQGAMVGLAAALVLRALAKASANARYVTACMALGVVAVAPIATFFALSEDSTTAASGTPVIRRETPEGRDSDITPVAAQQDTVPAVSATAQEGHASEAYMSPTRDKEEAGGPGKSVASAVGRLRESIESYMPWATVVWALGVAVLSLRFFGGWVRIWRVAARGRAIVEAGIRRSFEAAARRVRVSRPVKFVWSAAIEAPVVIGWLRPVILFPASVLTGMPAAQFEAIIAHELAHVKRYDYLVNLIQGVIETLLFYHPCVWWISDKIRSEREHCADDAAAAACGDRVLYAKALATLEEVRAARPAVAAGGGVLMQRIKRLLNTAPREDTLGGGWASAAALVAVVVLLFAGLSTTARGEKEANTKEAGDAVTGRGAVIVTADGEESAAYASIQDAIDAAPAGAVVRIGPGAYEESLSITKAVTLEGAGWDKTTIKPRAVSVEDASDFRARLDGVSSSEERDAINMEFVNGHNSPTVAIRGARPVAISGLKLMGMSGNIEGRTLSNGIVEVRDSEVRFSKCIITRTPGNGIILLEGSRLEVRECLVAAIWSTGIAVGRRCTARIGDSDIRNCYHRCITTDSDDTIIERCRISGSAWHGIRYDNASPTIEDCFIFENARFGTYGSGETAATVRRNVFYGNGMAGVSCWFRNHDTIEENTFAGNMREALLIVEAARPLVSRNVFFDNPTALSIWPEVSDSPATTDETLHVDHNLFWRNKTIGTRWSPKQDPDGASMETFGLAEVPGNAEADPLFANVATVDFSLAEGSPARRDGIGTAEPLGAVSPWPLLAEELAVIPETDTRDWNQWKNSEIELATMGKADEALREVVAAGAGRREAGKEASGVAGRAYLPAGSQDWSNWMHVTPGQGNDFAGGFARMSALRGRSFLLNTTAQEADIAVEVEAACESGPALAWICLRWKDGNNFYEIVLKKTQVEVWRKDKGIYIGILPSRGITLGDTSGMHVLKAQIVGDAPTITVWLDGEAVWLGKDKTGLEPLTGRYVALETEFSTVVVRSVKITPPDETGAGAAQSAKLPPIALLYHNGSNVRMRTLTAYALTHDPNLVDDLIRAMSVEDTGDVRWAYVESLMEMVNNVGPASPNVIEWKKWLAGEVAGGRMQIDYLPLDVDALSAQERGQIRPLIARSGPEYLEEWVTVLKTGGRDKMQDAASYMILNDHLPEVQEFLLGDWMSQCLGRRLGDVTLLPLYFPEAMMMPDSTRVLLGEQARACLDSDNATLVANVLHLVAGVEGWSCPRFAVPNATSKIRELAESADPEVARQARRAME